MGSKSFGGLVVVWRCGDYRGGDTGGISAETAGNRCPPVGK